MTNFYRARSAGKHRIAPWGGGVNHRLLQDNFHARIQAYEAFLRSCLSELKLDLPEDEIKGVYEPGQEYEFYRDIKSTLGLARKEIFIVDPYTSVPRCLTFTLAQFHALFRSAF